jgi:hypothetical protein
VTPVVTIGDSINVNNEGVINELGISTFSSFFKGTGGSSKDEIFPRWNRIADYTNMVPFWDLVGNFRVNPFIFWNIINHNVGILGCE